MIQSFGNDDSEKVWNRVRVPRLASELQRAAHRKLLILDAAENLNDLRIPPGNRLERLSGDRKGQYSIRINDQLRICFEWTASGPTSVEIIDDH